MFWITEDGGNSMENLNGWFEYSENQMIRESLDGVEIIEAVWLDTCPHDESKEYCVCYAEIPYDDEVTDWESAAEYFQEHCWNDSCVVCHECSKEEALNFVKEWCRKISKNA